MKRKKIATPASTASAYGAISGLRRRFWNAAIDVKIDSSQVQNSSEPCCPPHSEVTLYTVGSVVLEYAATYSSEKSLRSKPVHSATTAIVTIAHIDHKAWRALTTKSGASRRTP